MHVCCCAESEGTAQSDCWSYAGQTESSPLLTGREPRDALTPVDPPHLWWGGQCLTGDAVDAGTDLHTGGRQTGLWRGVWTGVCTGVEAGVITTADPVSERPRALQLISQETAVGWAAEWGCQLLETGSDPTESLLSAFTLALLPTPCRELVYWTTPPTHDVIAHLTGEGDRCIGVLVYY